MLAEIRKGSLQNKEQLSLVHKLDAVHTQLQQKETERQLLEEELAALKGQLSGDAAEVEAMRSVFAEKERRHAREAQRMMAQLQERAVTLDNNRKVLKTLHDLLDRKTQAERELTEKVSALQSALQEMQDEIHAQFQAQLDRLTLQNNRKIEALVAAHQQQLRKEQKEREKLGKKMQKEKMKLERAKERYDQQIVVARDLEEQLETMKEGQLKALQSGDDMVLRNAPPKKADPTTRQQELLNHARLMEPERDDAPLLPPKLKNGNKRQAELLAQAGKEREPFDNHRQSPLFWGKG